MLLASYKGTRPGLQGVGNVAIRARLDGLYSHSELVFEPGDEVEMFMPDRSCDLVAGTLWAGSSVAFEELPAWSQDRAGHSGGVRLKRIEFDPARWDLDPIAVDRADPLAAAVWFSIHEGALYDWSLIAKFVAWALPERGERFTCSEAVAAALLFSEAWRFDPCNLRAAVRRLSTEARNA